MPGAQDAGNRMELAGRDGAARRLDRPVAKRSDELPTVNPGTRSVFRKLIIQIPCLDEEATIGATLAALPRSVPGFEVVEWLIVDDGSRDSTVATARRAGVDHVVSLPHNQGLARAFMAGLEASLKAGADVIVNTDADNQYSADSIPDLVAPIVDGRAQIVVGARPIAEHREFSFTKKVLQGIGSAVVRLASGTQIADAPSGFRAIHASAALRLNVFGDYTYTLETIIQAGRKGIPITCVPIRVNPATRPSRLVRNIPSYVYRSMLSIARVFVLYKPLRFFFLIGTLLLLPGIALGLRFLVDFLADGGAGHIQSLILAAILIVTAMIVFVAGVLSDLTAANRILLEEIRMRQLRAEIDECRQPSTTNHEN
jgi:glycosyltransferase involved in cell wall biosynthesis